MSNLKNHEMIEKLIAAGVTIATAESCTGGLIAATVTDVAGASDCFGYGVVTYSNEAKTKLLGVKETTLAQFGAVSEETAFEMASGLKALSGAGYAVAVTGIAGPGGGSAQKPVGLVYIGLATPEKVIVKKNLFDGDRASVRRQTVTTALTLLTEQALHKK